MKVPLASPQVLLHKLAHLREVNQPPREFRRLMHDITLHLGYEATRELPTRAVDVTTPVSTCTGRHLNGNTAIIPILRAGLGMTEAMLELLPNAAVHHIGMYRMSGCEVPIQYYNRLPKDRVADVCYVLDPLVGSGITMCATVGQLKKWGCSKIVVISLITTPTGLDALKAEHPDVSVFTVEANDGLSTDPATFGKVLPGLGDASDRQFFNPEAMETDNPYGITMTGVTSSDNISSLKRSRKGSMDEAEATDKATKTRR